MKILVVHNDYQSTQIGGEDIVVNREIAGLKSALGDDNVFTYRVSNDTIRIGKLIRHLWGDRDHAKAIQSLVLKNEIDIVHVHNFFPLLTPSVFPAAKEAGAIVVHTLHNFRWWCSAGTLYRPEQGNCTDCLGKSWGYPAVKHRCYRDSRIQSLAASAAFYWYDHKRYRDAIDAYFVLTHVQQQRLADCGLHDKLWLKPNPILPPHAPLPPTQKKDYLFVGRLEQGKGLPLLLDHWKTLPKSFILRVIGEGEDRQALENSTANHSNIRFYGNQPHELVLQKMREARYLMHPSLAYETFGLTLVEALAQGTPVIGLNIGTRPEFIQSGHNGFLSDEPGLSQVILDSAQTPHYASLCAAASESAKRFYLPTVIDQQLQHYGALLEANKDKEGMDQWLVQQ